MVSKPLLPSSEVVDMTALSFILLETVTLRVRAKEEGMYYFIKEDKTIHKFPVPKRCSARYEQEQLRDTVPHWVIECPYCMKHWPNEEDEE